MQIGHGGEVCLGQVVEGSGEGGRWWSQNQNNGGFSWEGGRIQVCLQLLGLWEMNTGKKKEVAIKRGKGNKPNPRQASRSKAGITCSQ